MSYWREQNLLQTSETEIKTVTEQVKRATKYEAEYAKTITDISEVEFGEAEAAAATCQLCDHECSADSEKTLTRELEKQKTVIIKKYNKLKETNKQKKIIAENKKVESQTSCVQAQKSKDPAEKKKY